MERRQRTNSDVWIHHVACKFYGFFFKLRRYTAIWKQLLFANDTNRVRGAVLGLSQDGSGTNLFENFREHSLKVPKCEIFDVFDFNFFYVIKSL